MRLDLLLIDNPVERVSRAISRVAGKIGRLDTETPLRALDHGLSCSDLCLPNGAGCFDIHDDAELNVDEIIVRVGEERWSAHRAGPLRGWIGRRDKFRRRLAGRAKRRILKGCQILLHGAAGPPLQPLTHCPPPKLKFLEVTKYISRGSSLAL